MKRKSNGFTLIELLAVIVILGIIITIVVTNVVKYIGKAREGAFKDTYSKVLRDVKNKIALKNLGDTTEEVECSNYSDCASLYDVSTNDVNLIVTKVLENYIVNMEGKGSYAGISMEESTCLKNSYCSTNSISSNISSNGEEKETNIGSLLVLNVKNDTPINCKIDEDCSKYGKEIIEITSSTGGYAVTQESEIIIYDKNGDNFPVEKQEDAQKYKNLIFENYKINNNKLDKKSGIYYTCKDGSNSNYLKDNQQFYKNIKFDKALSIDNITYVYNSENDKLFFFYCDDKTEPVINSSYKNYIKIQ